MTKTGEAITSYTFELTSGYVTVAAYADMPSPILEWADEAEPVYAEFDSLCRSKKSSILDLWTIIWMTVVPLWKLWKAPKLPGLRFLIMFPSCEMRNIFNRKLKKI